MQLFLEASNGRQSASLEVYINVDSLSEMASALIAFPRHASDEYLFEVGSEREEDRWASIESNFKRSNQHLAAIF